MRWMLSLTDVSGKPTRMVLGKPAEASTSTSTGTASMPTRAKVLSLASMGDYLGWRPPNDRGLPSTFVSPNATARHRFFCQTPLTWCGAPRSGLASRYAQSLDPLDFL